MTTTMRVSMLASVALFALSLAAPAQAQSNTMSFFVTSVGSGKGGDLGGLAGADAHCQALAAAAGAGSKTWHAYLSTQARPGQPAVNARDRIGTGPWYNFISPLKLYQGPVPLRSRAFTAGWPGRA